MTELEVRLQMIENAVGNMHEKDGYDCPLCKNKGLRFRIRGEEIVSRQCECIKTRKSLYLMRESGIKDHMEEKSLDNFLGNEKHQLTMREKAKAYIPLKGFSSSNIITPFSFIAFSATLSASKPSVVL